MAFSGNFKARNTSEPYAPRQNWDTGVEPGHDDPYWGNDLGTPGPSNAPKRMVPALIEDMFDPETAEPPNYQARDREPKGHGGIGPAARSYRDMDVQAADNAGRSINRGAMDERHADMVFRDHTQTFSSSYDESLPASTGDDDNPGPGQAQRALRGRNSLGLNNPGDPEVNFSGDYLRRGKELNQVSDRRVPRRSLTHTKRDIHLNLAATAKISRGPQGQDYSPYSSPYTSVARMIATASSPMIRREPRPWDENAVSDGSDVTTEYDQAQMNSWGL